MKSFLSLFICPGSNDLCVRNEKGVFVREGISNSKVLPGTGTGIIETETAFKEAALKSGAYGII